MQYQTKVTKKRQEKVHNSTKWKEKQQQINNLKVQD